MLRLLTKLLVIARAMPTLATTRAVLGDRSRNADARDHKGGSW